MIVLHTLIKIIMTSFNDELICKIPHALGASIGEFEKAELETYRVKALGTLVSQRRTCVSLCTKQQNIMTPC